MRGRIVLLACLIGLVIGFQYAPGLWRSLVPPPLDLVALDDPEGFVELRRSTATLSTGGAVFAGMDTETTRQLDGPVCEALFGDGPQIAYFYDRNCPVCRRQEEVLDTLMVDPVGRPLALFGVGSDLAARAIIAAEAQGGGAALKTRLMRSPVVADIQAIAELARSAGLDAERLLSDMTRPETDATLARNHALAERFGIVGTPALVIGSVLAVGYVDAATLEAIMASPEGRSAPCG